MPGLQCLLYLMISASIVHATLQRHHCSYHFVEYIPSPFEKLWITNAPTWGASTQAFCDAVKSQEATIKQLLLESNVEKVPEPNHFDVPHEILSRYKYLRNCSSALNPGFFDISYLYSYIEPLATSLRQPAAFCLGGDMLGRAHYSISSRLDPTGVIANHTRRVFMFDLGASTWSQGSGGSSQNWFYENYKNHGLEIQRMFLWEVSKYDPVELFNQVPDYAFHTYQYFNIPANLEAGNQKNPLEIMRRIANPEDFVTVKLDIDNPALENAYINQLLNDTRLMSLVDEMFFEHHVHFEPLDPYWQVPSQVKLTLADSYNLFFKFRQQGVRFHGWP